MTEIICSRARCKNHAEIKLLWRNAKIHSEDRVKIWLACSEHRDYLVDYLTARSLFLRTEKLD